MLLATVVRSTTAMGGATRAARDADDLQMTQRRRAADVNQP
jgi:hypothetical protein